jgi:hypothetical protein
MQFTIVPLFRVASHAAAAKRGEITLNRSLRHLLRAAKNKNNGARISRVNRPRVYRDC